MFETEKTKIYYDPKYDNWYDDGDVTNDDKIYDALYIRIGDNKYMYIIKNIVIFAFYDEEKETKTYDYYDVFDLRTYLQNKAFKTLYKKLFNKKFTIKEKRKLINFVNNYCNIFSLLNVKKIDITKFLYQL